MQWSPSRRRFLAGAAAFTASPALLHAPGLTASETEVDVAIVGAGAAGIAAARRVASAGRSYAVFEASSRIGGRVWSASGGFGVIHDRGAHRISGSGRNPMVALGRLAGLSFYEPTPLRRLQVGMREARDREYDDFSAAVHRARRAIITAGEDNLDVPAAQQVPELGDWQATAGFVLGPLATSKDLDKVSTVDFARAEYHADQLVCRNGLATLLAAATNPITVELGTPVTRIDSREREAVTIETERGETRAKAVIVTASTNVLAAELIRFVPALPKETIDAITGLSLGTHDRLIVELAGNPLALADDQRVVFRHTDGGSVELVGRVGGTDLAYAEFVGDFGHEITDAGEAAMAAFVRDLLADHFGADAREQVGRMEAVRWSHAPWVRGGVSAAVPGKGDSRRALAKPVRDRIFFAGEAVHESWFGTVAGAWISGERAADKALDYLAPVVPMAPVRPGSPQQTSGR